MDQKVIDKLAWIYIQDRKVLMARSHGQDAFYTPGGGREEGETDEQALLREVKEELLVDLIPESLVYYNTFTAPAHGRPEGTVVQMTCYERDYKGELTPDNVEIAEFQWFSNAEREKLSAAGHLLFDDLVAKNKID